MATCTRLVVSIGIVECLVSDQGDHHGTVISETRKLRYRGIGYPGIVKSGILVNFDFTVGRNPDVFLLVHKSKPPDSVAVVLSCAVWIVWAGQSTRW